MKELMVNFNNKINFNGLEKSYVSAMANPVKVFEQTAMVEEGVRLR